ncbi:MAG: membrane protein [Polyangiaceae bacterium]
MSLRSARSASALATSLICCALSLAARVEAQPAPGDTEQKLVAPELVESAEPEYPESEKASAASARVELRLSIDEHGTVTDVEVTRSAGATFDAAAVAAARRAKFKPATRAGQPIPARIPFRFDFEYQPPKPAPKPASKPAPKPATKPAPPVPVGVLPATEVEIVGARPPREATRRELEQKEVARMPGTNGDALRAVESMPGVARPPGGMGVLLVRGAGPDDTAVFVDGTSIPIGYHFGGLTSVLPTELLERIDFVPGNFGPEWGRATGGIIDVGLRSPKRDRFHGLLQVDLIDGRVLAEGPIGQKTRLLFAGRRSWIDAWIGPVMEEGGGVGVSTAPVYYDYQAMLEHDVAKHTTARVTYFGFDDRMRFVLNAPDPRDPAFGGNFGETTSAQRLQVRTDTRLGDGARWVNTLSVGRDRHAFDVGAARLDLKYHPVAARSDLKLPLATGVKLVAGLDTLWMTADADYFGPPIQDYGDSPGPLFAQPYNALRTSTTRFLPAAYAMLELSPAPSLKLLPGIRADYTSDIGQTRLSPRLSARWDVASGFPRTTVKGGLGLYYQPPQPYQSVEPFGSSSIAHERAVHYGLGFEQELSRHVELSLDGFYRRLSELVSERPDATKASGRSYQNTGSGRAFGAELLLRYKADDRFFGWVAYTLSRSERRAADSEPTHLTQWDQTHVLTTLASYDLGRGWTLGARWRYTSGSPYTPAEAAVYDADAGAYQPSYGDTYSGRTPAFHRLDVRADKTWTFSDWKLSAYVDVQNAYNRKNPEGRAYNYNYSRSDVIAGLPILPVVGLRGEL